MTATSTSQTGTCHACGQEQYHTTPDTCGGCGANYSPPAPEVVGTAPAVGPFSTDTVIVSRHRGALEWLADTLPVYPGSTGWGYDPAGFMCAVDMNNPDQPGCPVLIHAIPIKAEVTAEDVRGKRVIGNLPLHLAALCTSVAAIEFTGTPPRGSEYTAADMTAAGAVLRAYRVGALS